MGRNLEVYVDDMMIKSKSLGNHLADLEENFIVIKNNKVRINPAKCAFKVTIRKFLGFMLTKRRIKVNLAKCQAILKMQSPTTIKEVQRLNGQITTLSQFMSKLVEKCLSFYKILKKEKYFNWGKDCEKHPSNSKNIYPPHQS